MIAYISGVIGINGKLIGPILVIGISKVMKINVKEICAAKLVVFAIQARVSHNFAIAEVRA